MSNRSTEVLSKKQCYGSVAHRWVKRTWIRVAPVRRLGGHDDGEQTPWRGSQVGDAGVSTRCRALPTLTRSYSALVASAS
jgi:hypothetical protein